MKKQTAILFWCIFQLLGAINTGAEDNCRILGSTLDTVPLQDPQDVFVVDNLAYVADGIGGLKILDITNPEKPIKIGAVATYEGAIGLAVQSQIVYVAVGDCGLQIFDASNPYTPVALGHLETPGKAEDIKIQGNIAYVADGTAGLQIIDISNSRQPLIVGAVEIPGTNYAGYASGVAIQDQTAYVAAGYHGGLKIIDVSDANHPVIVGSLDIRPATDVTVQGDSAYVVGYDLAPSFPSGMPRGGLWIIDVSDPQLPAIVGEISVGGAKDVAVRGTTAFVPSVYRGELLAVDVSDPQAPAVVGYLEGVGSYFHSSRGDCRGVTIAGNTAYVAGRGLFAVDVTDPHDLSIIGCASIANTPYAIAAQGATAYAAGIDFQIIDASDPFHPTAVGPMVILKHKAKALEVQGDTAFLLTGNDFTNVLITYDVSDPEHPTPLAELSFGGALADRIAVDGNTLCLIYLGSMGHLNFIDVSDPHNLVLVFGLYSTLVIGPRDVAVQGNICAATDSRGLQVVDISDPHQPVTLGSVAMASAGGVALDGDIVYVMEDGVLLVIDISNPQQPITVGTMDNVGDASLIGVGKTVYAKVGNDLKVVDVSTPWKPSMAGSISISMPIFHDVAIQGDTAYVAAGKFLVEGTNYTDDVGGGVQVVDVSGPWPDSEANGPPAASGGGSGCFIGILSIP